MMLFRPPPPPPHPMLFNCECFYAMLQTNVRGGPRRRGVPANESSCAVSDSVGSLQQSRTKFIESRTSNTYNDTLLILTTSRQLKYAFTSRFHLQRTLCT